MRSMTWFAAALILGAALVAAPPDSLAQPVAAPQPAQPAQPAAPAAFSAEQLEQLVAPIALYPDSLLTQTLMASTYPLEIVEAARWLQKNPALKDSALAEALKGQDWDPSVKSICGFPEVLKQMNENLSWMQDLGDAFLGQQAGLMDAVQRMRTKAFASGNLKSSEQQKVTQTSESFVIIEPANPEVIYVPTYSPTVVYGGWGYPSYYYPTMYLPPPPGIGFMTFTAGVAFGAAVWGHADWGHNSVNVDVNRYNNFNRNTSVNANRSQGQGGPPGPAGGPGGGQQAWQHDAEHRKGVNYKDSTTAKKYGGSGASNQVTRDQARGRGESGPQGGASAGTRPAGGGAGGAGRPSAGTLPAGGGAGGGGRPSAGAGASAGTRDVPRQVSSGSSGGSASRPSSSDRSYSKSGGSNSGAYSGSRSPSSSTSAASSRGSSSRGTSSYSGSKSSGGSRPSGGGGGGSRGGGGGGGRGGGGGGGRR